MPTLWDAQRSHHNGAHKYKCLARPRATTQQDVPRPTSEQFICRRLTRIELKGHCHPA
ncbi:hypothetical protein Tasa_048_211 [Tanticharoenia sakaeratensis NBRC 103193]|uniref:Uncharacterized protein n=1 Tax=Tanticharoenia sakaeratensis NBRC 103193 TaxID=1231623 RepID=A0A0D6MQ56_9PROT|nr:hypothetical protein Tasa_048_211 [Tanticharoenia sakaeratensis NBRC 103193]